MSINQKELVDELKIEWKKLWRERIDDKVRAEGIAINDYSTLFIDKGTIIHATRDFKALNFKEILEDYQILNAERYIQPDPHVGGWTKFIRTNISNKHLEQKPMVFCSREKKVNRQPKKGGRGWLHV